MWVLFWNITYQNLGKLLFRSVIFQNQKKVKDKRWSKFWYVLISNSINVNLKEYATFTLFTKVKI